MNAPLRTLLHAGLVLAVSLLASLPAGADSQRLAIEKSQAALGNELRDVTLIDTRGNPRRIQEFTDRPLAISLIFTGCAHSCSVATRHIDRVVRVARNALGDDSFTMLTIGFDHPVDNPETMAQYARRHGVQDPRWHFLSGENPGALNTLIEDIGFHFEPSPRGFDHTVKVTIIDQDGKVYRQVYGEVFSTPQLVEPLKDLVLGRPAPDDGFLTRLGNRVRLFCTAYDARGDRYYFDYSLFMGILIGALILGATIVWLGIELLRRGRRRPA